jgi:hypothetical protein
MSPETGPSPVATDLHIHSCLSPCGDDEMTPFDLVGMAKLCGLQLIALTDHNSAKNCPAAALAAHEYGIGFIPGMEVTTEEDIHCVCLFPSVEAALSFDRFLDPLRPGIANRPDIFGHQYVVSPDGTVSEEPELLITALSLSILDLPDAVSRFDGLFWPAHVDRDSNGLFAVLGAWPKELCADAAEVRFQDPGGIPLSLKIIKASDSHRLRDLPERGFPLPLETADFEGLKRYLRG